MGKAVLFRVDGGSATDTGTGHIARCLLLAGRLRERHALCFASLDEPRYVYGHTRIADSGYQLHLLPRVHHSDALRQLIHTERPDFVVSDLYEYDEDELGILKAKGARLMTFDHDQEHSRYSDFPINAVMASSRSPYSGPGYAVIPPPRVVPERNVHRRTFVCFGGFDYCDLTFTVAGAIVASKVPQVVDIVVSALYPRLDDLRRLVASTFHTVSIHVQPENFEALLADSDIAVVSCGLTMFQALAAGTAVVTIGQYEHQRRNVAEFVGAGACIDLGMGDHLDAADVARVLARLTDDGNLRRDLSRTARRLVDGQGLERVVNLINRELDG